MKSYRPFPMILLALQLGVTVAELSAAAPAGRTQRLTSPDQVPEGLAKSDWQSIRAAYEAGRHAFQPVDGGWQARNQGQQWTTRFDRRGFVAEPKGGGWQWGLELTAYGFPGAVRDIRGVPTVKADGQRLTYDWDATVQEWWVNDTRGLEHGFTVKERPPQKLERGARSAEVEGSGPSPVPHSEFRAPTSHALTFTLAVRGGLRQHVTSDSLGVEFRDAAGATVLTYAGLKVWDADGKILPSRFASTDPQPSTINSQPTVRLLVDERGARYPLTIDPLAQQAYLKAGNTGANDQFGYSVAVSGDTVVVGAPFEDSSTTGVNSTPAEGAPNAGGAYIFTPLCAPNLTVLNPNDSGPDSLRQALLDVCPGGTINFAPALAGQTIVLTSGELLITNSLTIIGPGTTSLAISGNGSSRVFSINSGTVTIAGLTITNGNGVGAIFSGYGGGIFNLGTLTMSNCLLSGNSSGIAGGAIYNITGTLAIQDSTLSGNLALADGGGLYNYSGALTIRNSTLRGNSATSSGAGIFNVFGLLTVQNSTLTGNSATGNGGGIYNNLGTVTLQSSTLTGNRGAAGLGGGLFASGAEQLTNCIVAGNFSGSGTTPSDIGGGSVENAAYNLIGDAATAGGLAHDVNGNIVGNAGAGTLAITSILETNLAFNGGPTMTHALIPGSPALNAGDFGFTDPSLPFDQRGAGFPRLSRGRVDIGAYESQERFSANAIGYVDASFSAGSNLVANPLNAGNNTISNLFRGVPEGSVFLPWNPDAHDPDALFSPSNVFHTATGWTDPSATLITPSGGFLYLPAATRISFVGDVLWILSGVGSPPRYSYPDNRFSVTTMPASSGAFCDPSDPSWQCSVSFGLPIETLVRRWNRSLQRWNTYSLLPPSQWYDDEFNPLHYDFDCFFGPDEALMILPSRRFSAPIANSVAGSGVTSAPPSVVLRDWQADGTNGSFRFATTTNLDYTLFRSTNLTSDPWTPFQSGVAQSVNGFATVTVPVPAQGGAFYKLGSASSAPVLFNLSRGRTSFEFQFVGALGTTYNVQHKRILNENCPGSDAHWQTLFSVSGSGGLLTVTDSNAVASSGYYRLQY